MKILLIAPRHRDINQIPEIRQLTSIHRTTVLNGDITVQEIFDEVRTAEYDIVHFATDLISEQNDEMYISEKESLGMTDTEQILKLAKAKLVFLNFCSSARFATFLTNRGIDFAIYTTIKIEDRLAWRFPLAFYEQLKRQEKEELITFNAIYETTSPSDGSYGCIPGIKYYQAFFAELRMSILELKVKIDTLTSVVTEHAMLLGVEDFAGRIKNKWILGIAIIMGLMILLASSVTIYNSFIQVLGT